MNFVNELKCQLSILAMSILLSTALCGCVTMGRIAKKREELDDEKSKWVQKCVDQANRAAQKYGFYIDHIPDQKEAQSPKVGDRHEMADKKQVEYENRLENRGRDALVSLKDRNCNPNDIWLWFSYPDCIERAEIKLKSLNEKGCNIQEFVASLQEARLKINQEIEKDRAKEADEKKYLDRQTAFILDLEKSNATHVLLRLQSGQDGRTCSEQIDGSFICESGFVCDKSGYIKATKDRLAGIKPPRIDTYCDMDSASSQNFFFIARISHHILSFFNLKNQKILIL